MADARAEIAKLEALHAEHPQGRIFTHLAEAYRKAGELERAREVLAEGIGRHPEYSSAHVVLARVLMDMGEEEAAASEFERVLELDGQNLVALRCLGDMARSAGQTDEAADYYRRLLDVEPSDDDVLRILEEMEEAADAGLPGLEAEDELGDALPTPADDSAPVSAEDEDLPWAADRAGDEAMAGPDADEGEPWITGGADAEADAYSDVGWVEGDDGEPVPPMPPETGEPGVMTETIAQVYARQGLYEQAAAVYRELVRNRPDDSALRSRLQEMEALAASPSPGTGEGGREEPAALEEPAADLPGLDDDDEESAPHVAPLPGLETSETDEAPEVAPLAGLESDEVDPETGLRPVEAAAAGVDGLPEESVRDVPAPPEEEAPWSPEDAEEAEEEAGRPEPWSAGDFGAAEEPGAVEEDAAMPEPWAAASDLDDVEDVEDEPAMPEPWAAAGDVEEIGGAGDDEDVEESAAAEEVEAGDEPWEPWAASEDEDAEQEMGAPPPLPTLGEADAEGQGWPAERGGGADADADAAPDAAAEAEQVESVWTGADGASSAEESPYAWAEGEPEAAADESPPIGTYLRSLLDWSRSGGGGQGGRRPPGDDDLDTFRSWLESLKQ